jgi:arylsulfatase A-like enzyme
MTAVPSDGQRRNLLLITTDQERWCADDPVPLPAHGRLRRTGTSFDRYYAASVACSSARSVMFTGKHVPQTGVLDNVGLPGQPSMTTTLATLGTLLSQQGYVTAYKGKWHLSTEALPGKAEGPLRDALLPYGFADYNEVGDDLGGPYEGYRRDASIASDAGRWLATAAVDAHAAGRPWCLAVNFVNPHDIMFGTSDEQRLAKARALPPEAGAFVGPPDDDRYAARWDLPDDANWADLLDPRRRPGAHVDFALANQMFTGEAASDLAGLRRFRDYYLNCLRDVDGSVGVVLDALDDTGLAGDTTIVYTSDHGELAGAHGLFGKGPCAYDENLRLPLFVVDPTVEGGGRTSTIGSQVDLVPTLLALALGDEAESITAGLPGVDVRAGTRDSALFVYDGLIFLDGAWARRTFGGMRTDDQVTGRDFTKRGFMRTIVTEQHKFSRYFAPGDHHRPASSDELWVRNTLELFDLVEDPGERSNLALDPTPSTRAVIDELDGRLSALIAAEMGDDDGHWLPSFVGTPWCPEPSSAR